MSERKDRSFFYFFILLASCWISRAITLSCWLRAYIGGVYHARTEQISDIFRVIEVVLYGCTILFALFCMGKQLKSKSKYKVLKAFTVAIVLVIHIVAMSFAAGLGLSVSVAVTDILSKRTDGIACYFTVNWGNGVELACSQYEYDTLVVDKDVQYSLSFRVLTPLSKHGFLEGIDADYVDNRR